MVKHRLHVDNARLTEKGMQTARKAVTKVCRQTLNRSAVLCPVDTGNLRASGEMKVADRGTTVVGEVTYTANYAAAVHNGRKALTIRAKGNGRLKFTVDGRTVYAREVRQPARAARPFLTTALDEVATAAGFRVTIG